MGPEQIQRRFLPIGRTGVPLGGRGESRKPHARQRAPRGNLGRDLPELPRAARGLPSQAPTARKDKQFIVSALQRGSSHKGERGQLFERTASESMGLVLDDPSACSAGPGLLGAQLIQSQLARNARRWNQSLRQKEASRRGLPMMELRAIGLDPGTDNSAHERSSGSRRR
jgi:hypothetical protein